MTDLAANLPIEYEYMAVEKNQDSYQIRVKGVRNAEEANTWLECYSDLTMTTWRINKTYPHSGRVNVFKRYYRCQRKTDSRHRGKDRRTSKNTDCPAQIEIIIKRYNPRSRSKYLDQATEEYPAFIRFRKKHNHTTSDAEALKHRDMSVDTREKLLSLFRAGHTPSSARNYLKMELLLNHPDSCGEKMADTHFVPSISVVTHLYKTVSHEFDNDIINGSCTKVTARELKAMMGNTTVHSRPAKRQRFERPVNTAAEDEVVEQSMNQCVVDEVDTGANSPLDASLPSSLNIELCKVVVDELCARVKQGLDENPDMFVPAVEAMHRHLSTFCISDSGLLATLHSMEYYITPE